MAERSKGKIAYNNDREYDGEILNGKPDGYGRFVFPEGEYNGNFLQGKYHGEGTMTYKKTAEYLFDNRDYDLRDKLIGEWREGKRVGRFMCMSVGLPYDLEYDDGNDVFSKIYYDLPVGESVLKDNAIKCWYGGQSGFIIETQEETFVFDWYRSSMPQLNKEKPVYIFISHLHLDHYNPRIFTLMEEYDVPEIYLGYDRDETQTQGFLDKISPSVEDVLSCFKGEQRLITDFGSVSSLYSTDLGVAFVVKAGEHTFFHAGDLFWRPHLSFNEFKQQGSDATLDKYNMVVPSNERTFKEYTHPLSEVGPISYAMLPMDPRWSDYGMRTVRHYLEIADIKVFSPMHLWEKWDFTTDCISLYPEMAKQMVAINPDKIDIKQSIELNKPYFIEFA
jgi:hypothetical protein